MRENVDARASGEPRPLLVTVQPLLFHYYGVLVSIVVLRHINAQVPMTDQTATSKNKNACTMISCLVQADYQSSSSNRRTHKALFKLH